MSVKEEVQTNLPENLEQPELSSRERMVVQMFRWLDEQSQNDIIRFLDALLTPR
ncbi:hypothetical protein GPJ81_17890 [Pseudomonas alkylphenolica]|uniref:Uncharacterized protein n=1 Tax=Pseudomonas alkylphenolica TaxID=237609 RepID=A0A6I6HA06_9PSED|nr:MULTISPECIES: hypothetical protein [Pseudomonas]MBM3113251.1 hypothetical protein [Pseudomonas arcuscaelestis]QGW78474.1 hypothetical protein GPJ81_17890 [Pseudomonas alkylphenolica]